MLELVKIPDSFLTQPARALTDDEIKAGKTAEGLVLLDFAKELVEAMLYYHGIGLAAPQVRVGLRIFAVDIPRKPFVVLNPILTEFEGSQLCEEGCLSIPGTKGTVRRHKKLRMTGFSVSGTKIDIVCKDLMANVVQHEYDHLEGVLFTGKAIAGSLIQEKEE